MKIHLYFRVRRVFLMSDFVSFLPAYMQKAALQPSGGDNSSPSYSEGLHLTLVNPAQPRDLALSYFQL